MKTQDENTQVTCNRMHHSKALNHDKLYIPWNKGGRGMIQLELSYKTPTIGQHEYLTTTADWMIQLVLAHDKTKKLDSINKQSYKFKQKLNIHQN